MENNSIYSVPLCFVYPALLHYKAVAKTPMEKAKDILLCAFGLAAMIFTTAQTIKESCLRCALRNESDYIQQLMAQPEPAPVAAPGAC